MFSRWIFSLTPALVVMTAGIADAGLPVAMKHNDSIILVHGLGRTSRSLTSLERFLASRGYRVLNLDYPSTRLAIEQSVARIAPELEAFAHESGGRVHFVTHSLGGIIVRSYLNRHPMENLGRVVMLSPPNQGSELADFLRRNVAYRWITGPAGQQLGTDPASVPNTLGAAHFDLGIITGNRSLNPLLSRVIPGENDGKVSVARAGLAGMADFLVAPHSHTFIASRRPVQKQVLVFLEQGTFRREQPQELRS